jgi:hypothetical protein
MVAAVALFRGDQTVNEQLGSCGRRCEPRSRAGEPGSGAAADPPLGDRGGGVDVAGGIDGFDLEYVSADLEMPKDLR